MPIDREKFIQLLDRDLALEYSAMVQYIQHSGVLSGTKFAAIKKEIQKHAGEELGHALNIVGHIDRLGGFPTASVPPCLVSRVNTEMLKQDLTGEEDAITRYTVRITQAESLEEPKLARDLREILAVEQEHAEDLRKALGMG